MTHSIDVITNYTKGSIQRLLPGIWTVIQCIKLGKMRKRPNQNLEDRQTHWLFLSLDSTRNKSYFWVRNWLISNIPPLFLVDIYIQIFFIFTFWRCFSISPYIKINSAWKHKFPECFRSVLFLSPFYGNIPYERNSLFRFWLYFRSLDPISFDRFLERITLAAMVSM